MSSSNAQSQFNSSIKFIDCFYCLFTADFSTGGNWFLRNKIPKGQSYLELKIGITDNNPQWLLVLKQIGVIFEVINPDTVIDPKKYAVVIVCSKHNHQSQEVMDFLNGGGSILTEANTARAIFNVPTKKITIKYLQPENSLPFEQIPICDLQIKSEIAVNSSYLRNQDGIDTVCINKSQSGNLIILPSGFTDVLKSYKIKRKNFQPQGGRDYPSERISAITKGAIRRIIEKAIQYLFHERKLPFVHLWNFPDGKTNIFCFRIDTDFALQDEVINLYELCKKREIPATWFVETKTKENWINLFGTLENQEISYHCYRHRIFKDYNSNYNDFTKGLSILKKADIKPIGYAAPYGEWTPILGNVIQDLGFEYSSEFGLSYDDLPFQPIINNSASAVYQIPIHPVSIRKLIITKHNEEQILQYYMKRVDEKIILGDPIIFYHHPSHKHLNIFSKIFKNIHEENIPVITMGDYSSWWRKRSEFNWEANYINNQLHVKSKLVDTSMWIKIDYPDGKESLKPVNSEKLFNYEQSHVKIKENLFDYNSHDLRKYNWQILLNDCISFYGKLRQ